MKSGSVTSAVNQLDDFLMYDNFELQRYTNTGEEDSIQYQTEFHIVSKAIRAVKSLPLSITNIHGLDSLSRNTKVCHCGWCLSLFHTCRITNLSI